MAIWMPILSYTKGHQRNQRIEGKDQFCRLRVSPAVSSVYSSKNYLSTNHNSYFSVTYDEVDKTVRKAIENMGNFVPKEVKELSSNYPKPHHIAVVSAILEEATKILSTTYDLTVNNIHHDLRKIDPTDTIISGICPTFLTPVRCELSKYRTLSGMCNNLQYPSWASARSAMIRYLPPSYEDGISEPRKYSVTGHLLPNPRYISNVVHSEDSYKDHGITIMLANWGQMVVHDINFGAPTLDEMGEPINCCAKPQNERHPACYVFDVPHGDSFYSQFNRSCLNFVRLTPGLRPNCPLGPREPMNIVSGYLDASLVYGSSSDESHGLREHKGGRLQAHAAHQKLGLKDLLPAQTEKPDFLCNRQMMKNMFCFKSGDIRTNQQLPLTVLHTLLMREHNRIADTISYLMPDMDDNTIFEETRRIIGAQMQVITYKEFLPIVLGDKLMAQYDLNLRDYGYYDGYDSRVNAEPKVAFQAAAFRFGHSLVPDAIRRYNKFHQTIGAYRMSHLLRQPFELYKPGIVDTFLMGMVAQEANRMDASLTKELTNHLFEIPGRGFGGDLAAINILRGRDVGLASYNEYREYCRLPKLTTFDDLEGQMPNDTIQKMASVYASVDDIDLWSGGTSENPMPGAVVGPTFGCLMAEQFSSLKRGDRFWFENGGWPSSFTPYQVDELRKASLAKLICDNSDDIPSIQLFPMLPVDEESNPQVSCDKIVGINLSKFFSRDAVKVS